MKLKRIGASGHAPAALGKNQLVSGSYLIGRDIPAGVYDLTWVYGNGRVLKFMNDHDTSLGATTYLQHVGNTYDYEHRQCFNVDCREGELLKLYGNVVLGIAHSRAPELEL